MPSNFELTPHYKYHELARKISEVFYEVDPMNIADIEDEYDPEATDMAQRAVIGQQKITAEMVKDVFDAWFRPLKISDEDCNEIILRLRRVVNEYVG